MKNKPKNPTEAEEMRMQNLWGKYERTELRLANEFEEQHPEVVPATRLEEIWAWEEYAVGEYVKGLQELPEDAGVPLAI